jgi:type IV pilus assembly protein PilF
MWRSRALAPLALLAAVLAGCQSTKAPRTEGVESYVPGTRPAGAADVYVELAAGYLQDGQLGVALSKAQTALEKDASNPQGHTVLGMIYQRMGEQAKAEAEFQEAVRLAPKDYYVRNAFGVFLCGQRRYTEASAQFDEAIRNPLNQSPWVAMTNAAMCAEQQSDRTTAQAQLREALKRNPTFAPALLQMARASLDGGNYAEARSYLQRYQSVASLNAESLAIAAEVEQRLGDRNKAAAYERLLRERFPDALEAQRVRGR